jgi:UDP-N-acetyl-D-glucosamine dehydrogenase
LSSKSTQLAKSLYSKIIKEVHATSSPEVAETSKLLENTFRLVNIALISEFTMVAEKLGINIWEVIKAAKTKPFGFMPFYPGPGIGGHCIGTDPKFLSWKSKKMGFKTKMIDLASYIDHFMPEYVVERVDKALGRKKISNSKILILGVTYKKDVKDLRESPALDIIEKLQKKKTKVDYYDPLIPYLRVNNINLKRSPLNFTKLKQYDCIILVTGHKGVDYQKIRKNAKLIFDTRNIYKKNYSNVRRL